MLDFFKKLFTKNEQKEIKSTEIKNLSEIFEEEEELKIATMMATIIAAESNPLSNFKVVSIKRV